MTTVVRPKIGWGGLFRNTWRQHRVAILSVGALVPVWAALMLWTGISFVSPNYGPVEYAVAYLLFLYLFPALIAALWAAPLISREYEQGTYALAWSQDVPPGRWLAGKMLALGGFAAVCAVVLGAAAEAMVWLGLAVGGSSFSAFSNAFEANPLVQAGYVLFGLGLGVALSALTRRTVFAAALTMAGFAVARIVVATWRLHLLPPERLTRPIEAHAPLKTGRDSLRVDQGYFDAFGDEVTDQQYCTGSGQLVDLDECMAEAGAVGVFVEYHPVERLATFQLIEFGIFAALAAALFVVAWRVVSR